VQIQSVSPEKSFHVTVCSGYPNQLARTFLGEVWMYKLSLFLLRDLVTRDESISSRDESISSRDESISPHDESISPRCALQCILG
jgi:hypothetical protein